MKRKIASMIMVFALMVASAGSALAAQMNKYKLSEPDISISIPDDYTVFTRDTKADDPKLALYGLTHAKMLSVMKSGNIYLEGLQQNLDHYISITKMPTTLENFKAYSNAQLTQYIANAQKAHEEQGVTYSQYEIYRHKQTKFVKWRTHWRNTEDLQYGLEYATAYNGELIFITFGTKESKINAADEKLIDSVIDSIVFGKEKQPEKSDAKNTKPIQYKNEELGLSFMVPAGWTQMPLSEEDEGTEVSFFADTDITQTIYVGIMDLWNHLEPDERAGLTRADMNNEILLKAFKSATGEEVDGYYIVQQGDHDYLIIEYTYEDSEGEAQIWIQASYMEDGMLYMFESNAQKDSAYFRDFESLLKSVKFNDFETVKPGDGKKAAAVHTGSGK